MHRARVSAADATFIADRVRNFANEAAPTWQWQSQYVEQFGALPLYLGWTETLGILPDGRLVRWSTEDEYVGLRPIETQLDANVALVEGSKKYPALAHLIPQRPSSALTCPACRGTGRGPLAEHDAICSCGGTGWLPAAGDG
jgi:hypothetical protein